MSANDKEKWWHFSGKTGDTIRAFVRMVMGGFAIVLFSRATWIIWQGGPETATLAGVAIAGGGFCLIFFFLTQFKKFKGFGIEAESWEREMEDAKRITNNLRNLAQAVAEPSIMVLMRTGRWSSNTSRREAHDLVKRFEGLLAATDTSQEDIARAVSDYYRFTLFDMVNLLRAPLKKLLDEKVKPFKDRMDAFGSPITDHQGHNAACEEWRKANARADAVIKSLSLESLAKSGFDGVINSMKSSGLLDEGDINAFLDTFREEVADIRFFQEHRKLRRPEVWFSTEDD